jgi:hypothetical protein
VAFALLSVVNRKGTDWADAVPHVAETAMAATHADVQGVQGRT